MGLRVGGERIAELCEIISIMIVLKGKIQPIRQRNSLGKQRGHHDFDPDFLGSLGVAQAPGDRHP